MRRAVCGVVGTGGKPGTAEVNSAVEIRYPGLLSSVHDGAASRSGRSHAIVGVSVI